MEISDNALEWVMLMVKDKDACHNKHIRLELLRFIEVIPFNQFRNPKIGMTCASALIQVVATMDHEEITPRPQSNTISISITNMGTRMEKRFPPTSIC